MEVETCQDEGKSHPSMNRRSCLDADAYHSDAGRCLSDAGRCLSDADDGSRSMFESCLFVGTHQG